MESHNYECFITETVEAMLPIFSNRDICLTMKITSDWTDHGYDVDGNTKVRPESQIRTDHFILFHRPSNYTKVLYLEIPTRADRQFLNLPCRGEIVMKQLSDHDSCWRSDGMRWVFETFVNAWNFFEERGVEGRDIDPMFHYSIFGGSPQYWLIKSMKPHDPDPESRWISDYAVELDKRIDLCDISKYMPKKEKI